MTALDHYIYTRARTALESIPEAEREDIYVVSFFVYDEDDDPRRPTLTVGFNTETEVASNADSASDDAEARWNYAFWLQNELTVIFDSSRDPDGAAIREAAMEEAAYTFPLDDDLALSITTPWFVANAVFAARRLHDEGDIVALFGRPIPVLVHELEYYDLIAMQNLAANPPGVADAFVQWCRFDA